jgi:hypothetical protein
MEQFNNQLYVMHLAHEYMKMHIPYYEAGIIVFDELEKAIKQAESDEQLRKNQEEFFKEY